MSKLKKEELLACLDEWMKYIKKHLGIDSYSFKAYQQIYQIIQRKPEITEEWIEEKAKELNNEIILELNKGNPYDIAIYQNFIRSLVEEIGEE